MDIGQRDRLIAQARRKAELETAKREQAQLAHCEALEQLEGQGINLEDLVELYGDAILTPYGASRVEQLGRILDAINGPASSTLVVGSTEIGIDTSFSHSTQRIVKAHLALFEDPTQCRLEFVRDEASQIVRLVISGTGYKAIDKTYNSTLPNPTDEPSEIDFVLTQRYYGDNVGLRVMSGHDYDMVETFTNDDEGDNIGLLANKISRKHLLGSVKPGPALHWLDMDYLTPQERQRFRDKNTPSSNLSLGRENFDPSVLASREAERIRIIQEAHLKIIDRLETAYGLDMSIFTDIYGDDVLDGTKKSSERTVTKWLQLYEAVGSQDKFLAIADTRPRIVPGCYGFGAKAQYTSKTMLAIFKEPETAQIVARRDASGNSQITIKGTGVYRSHDDTGSSVGSANPETYTEQEILIAARKKGESRAEDNLGISVHADSLPEIYRSLRAHRPYTGYNYLDDGSLNWLLRTSGA